MTWRTYSDGTAVAAANATHPGRFLLQPTSFRGRFAGGAIPNSTSLRLHVESTDLFWLYIAMRTDQGLRRLALVPSDAPLRLLRNGLYYRGVGAGARNNEAANVTLDLQAIATAVEPGIEVRSVDFVHLVVRGTTYIEIADGSGPPGPGGPITAQDAVRFLTQATFGASPDGIEELVSLGSYNSWIDQQYAEPVSLTEPYTMANSNGSLSTTRHYIWWENAIRGEDQLRQRLAYAWSQIFVVSDRDYTLSNSQYAMCNFYDMLATEATGNFRDMLERVTLHPVMGVYLSMVRNERADPSRNVRPDENFAREVLQLFTIGLHELTPDGQVRTSGGQPTPSYDQRTVEEFAKLFTGWNYADSRYWDDNNYTDKRLPMIAWEPYHEPEAKDLLNGVRVPAGGTAGQDMTRALDNIFAHPNVGPFLARQLIQRLVTSNPSPAYVGRVAAAFNNNGSGVRGDLAATSRAVLTDAEARTGHQTMAAQFGKIKEPLLRLTNLWRAFDALPGPEASHGEYRTYARPVSSIENVVGQAPMRAQSVFNFYLPDNPLGPGSDLVAPELAILAEINVASTNNMLFDQIYNHHNRTTERLNISRINIESALALATDAGALVDHLDQLLLAGALPTAARSSLVAHLNTHPTDADGQMARTLDAIYGIVGSPFHLVQK